MSNTNEVSNGLPPIHVGEFLLEDFMIPLGLSANKLAKELGVTPARINEIVKGKRNITAETALLLEEYFGMSAKTWLNLQTAYDLKMAKLNQKTQEKIKNIHKMNKQSLLHLNA